MKALPLIASLLLLSSSAAWADTQSITVHMHKVSAQGVGEEIGTVTLTDSSGGLLLTPNLKSLSPGPHGFHVHAKGSCDPAPKDGQLSSAEAAGGHLDPGSTGKHEGPMGQGHLGDLPALEVGTDGTATAVIRAPRLTIKEVRGGALMIHQGGDNYSDTPAKLGGGGPRIACGVIK
ncbi:MAG: superoxide dismutase family protein [Deltaproteobacteria bacterium]|nr:superoxide dismutase family protein [Deltaproteobacteria bacterium]